MADALAPPRPRYRPMPIDFPGTFIRVGWDSTGVQTRRNCRRPDVASLRSSKVDQEIPMTKPLSPLPIILAGADLGRLTLIREVDPIVRTGDGGRVRRALFRCACGNERTLRIDNVKRGLTRSCGCFNIDVIRARSG